MNGYKKWNVIGREVRHGNGFQLIKNVLDNKNVKDIRVTLLKGEVGGICWTDDKDPGVVYYDPTDQGTAVGIRYSAVPVWMFGVQVFGYNGWQWADEEGVQLSTWSGGRPGGVTQEQCVTPARRRSAPPQKLQFDCQPVGRGPYVVRACGQVQQYPRRDLSRESRDDLSYKKCSESENFVGCQLRFGKNDISVVLRCESGQLGRTRKNAEGVPRDKLTLSSHVCGVRSI